MLTLAALSLAVHLVVNALGARVLTAFSEFKQYGPHKEKVDLGELPTGVYMLVLKTAEETSTQMLRIVKYN